MPIKNIATKSIATDDITLNEDGTITVPSTTTYTLSQIQDMKAVSDNKIAELKGDVATIQEQIDAEQTNNDSIADLLAQFPDNNS